MLPSPEERPRCRADRAPDARMRQLRAGRTEPDNMNLTPARKDADLLDPDLDAQPAPGPVEPPAPGPVEPPAGAGEGADPVRWVVWVAGSTPGAGAAGATTS